MIEDVERLGTELRLHALCDPRIFQQGHVKVVDPRSAKEPAHGISDRPKVFWSEVIWVEVGLSRTRIPVYKQGAANDLRLVDRAVESSAQRVVIGFAELDGLAFGECRDTRQSPSRSESPRRAPS